MIKIDLITYDITKIDTILNNMTLFDLIKTDSIDIDTMNIDSTKNDTIITDIELIDIIRIDLI